MSFERLGQLKRLLLIAVGVAIYTFGFVKFNMANALAEGGVFESKKRQITLPFSSTHSIYS